MDIFTDPYPLMKIAKVLRIILVVQFFVYLRYVTSIKFITVFYRIILIIFRSKMPDLLRVMLLNIGEFVLFKQKKHKVAVVSHFFKVIALECIEVNIMQ